MICPYDENHLDRYAEIFRSAFAGPPWNEDWPLETAGDRIREIMEGRSSFGLECLCSGRIAGFLIGTSVLFPQGRLFEILDLAVDPEFQGRGVASELLRECAERLKERGVFRIRLVTSSEGNLRQFYEKFGFEMEAESCLMRKSVRLP